jgi:hypothetical protein
VACNDNGKKQDQEIGSGVKAQAEILMMPQMY